MRDRIFFLDWLRSIAFLSVFVGHIYWAELLAVTKDATVHPMLRQIVEWLLPLCFAGGAGVILFFVVSGYIITHVIASESVREFAIKRALRIYPLYFLAVAMFTLHNYFDSGVLPKIDALLAQLSLLGDFFGARNTLAGVEWSLRIELLFYIVMIALKQTGFVGGRWDKFFNHAVIIIIVAASLMPHMPRDGVWNAAYFNMFFPFIMLGVMIRRHEDGRATLEWLIATTVLCLVLYWLSVPTIKRGLMAYPFEFTACAVFMGFWLCRARITYYAPVAAISSLTYACYLFHKWIFDDFQMLAAKLGLSGLGMHAGAIGLLIALCYCAHRLVEAPAIKLGKRLSRGKSVPGIMDVEAAALKPTPSAGP